MINEAIKEKLDLENTYFNATKTIKIVDFGCSVGPNTFFAVDNIIEAIEFKYRDQKILVSSKNLEFQVFFNDHVENDFNTLFKTLHFPPKYFAAGVPGSFYLRLFPQFSIHFAYTSYSLHWLSKIPKEIIDKNSIAYNKGIIQCSGLNKEVVKVYASQLKNDLNIFLNARAQELVPGGLMVILTLVLPNGVLMSETAMGISYDFIGSCLMDMANLGLINAEKVDSFNLPLYFPHITELKELIEKNGYFSIERFEPLDNPMKSKPFESKHFAVLLRSTLEGVIRAHFGDIIVDKIFEYLAQKFENDPLIFDEDSFKNTELFILLKRNVN
ncbi:probable S-adenosylmethionine-dependent methyltransferase At5g38100 [Carica papaya]|uniref:probable S-adenosylmethionine-dependent methyltransferase At5g38100 n=1 Tax=Carica papaya TaxID=3649 RepID=UPI000B8CEB70|nr:probable S-adenosylmethionine-dependent methyltransferase At5g38100 [Carica papaya]